MRKKKIGEPNIEPYIEPTVPANAMFETVDEVASKRPSLKNKMVVAACEMLGVEPAAICAADAFHFGYFAFDRVKLWQRLRDIGAKVSTKLNKLQLPDTTYTALEPAITKHFGEKGKNILKLMNNWEG